MQTTGKRDSLLALHIDQAMGNVILIQKIVQLTALARIRSSQDAKASKVSIAV